jgi:hypothetical protein
MFIKESQLRRLVRQLLSEQVIGYKSPDQQKQDDQNPDYLDDGSVGVSAQKGSQSDDEASADAVKSLTQQRQSQLDSGDTVSANDTGRGLSQLRKSRG